MNIKIRWRATKGTNGLWGVDDKFGVLYEAIFSKEAARRIAELENSDCPPKDWECTEEILINEGLLTK